MDSLVQVELLPLVVEAGGLANDVDGIGRVEMEEKYPWIPTPDWWDWEKQKGDRQEQQRQ